MFQFGTQLYKGSEMKLNRQNFAEMFRTDYYLVSVQFMEGIKNPLGAVRGRPGDKSYTYKISKSQVVDVGDRLLVCTVNEPNEAEMLKVVVVVSINKEPEIEEESPFQYKWIVAKFDDVMAAYYENIAKDTNLKRAVHKLEKALERVSLRQQLKMAMAELPDDERLELSKAFGVSNLLGNDDGKEENQRGSSPQSS